MLMQNYSKNVLSKTKSRLRAGFGYPLKKKKKKQKKITGRLCLLKYRKKNLYFSKSTVKTFKLPMAAKFVVISLNL